MAHFFEGDTEWAGFFTVVEEGAEFGFGGTGENFAHDLAKNVDGAVWLERRVFGCRILVG